MFKLTRNAGKCKKVTKQIAVFVCAAIFTSAMIGCSSGGNSRDNNWDPAVNVDDGSSA